jgi:hypothetical protein
MELVSSVHGRLVFDNSPTTWDKPCRSVPTMGRPHQTSRLYPTTLQRARPAARLLHLLRRLGQACVPAYPRYGIVRGNFRYAIYSDFGSSTWKTPAASPPCRLRIFAKPASPDIEHPRCRPNFPNALFQRPHIPGASTCAFSASQVPDFANYPSAASSQLPAMGISIFQTQRECMLYLFEGHGVW